MTLFESVLVLTILAGSIAVSLQVARRLLLGQPLVPLRPRSPVPWKAGHLIVVLVASAGIQLASTRAIMGSWTAEGSGDGAESATADSAADDGGEVARKIAAGCLTSIGTCGFALLLLRFAAGATARDCGLDFGHVAADFKLGVGAYLAVALPVHGLQAVLSQFIDPSHPATDAIGAHPTTGVLVLVGALAVVVAPVTEEFLFRVVLQGWLEALLSRRRQQTWQPVEDSAPQARSDGESSGLASRSGEAPSDSAGPCDPVPLLAVVDSPSAPDVFADPSSGVGAASAPPGVVPMLTSALLFALVHLNYGPSAGPLFVFGLTLGYLYRQTHRILPCIFCHMSLNTVTMALVTIEAVKS